MKPLFKKIFIFGLLVLSVAGFLQLTLEVLLAQGVHHRRVAWILGAIEKTSFTRFDPTVFKSDRPIDPLKGLEKEKILEFLKVDVNHASLEDLIGLPRVGPTIAQRIVQMREFAGPFLSLEDLGRVKGLGPKSLEILKDRVRFDEKSGKS